MKSHRGLASVVGAVFLIAIVIGALSYISYSIGMMGDFSEALITEESRIKDKQSEAFEITSIDFTAANKLDVVIKNTGQIPLKITTLYIDEIGVNDVVNKTTINETISPGSSFDFISESIDVDIDPTKGYNLKLITSRGETQTFYLNSASQEPLDIRLIASPEIIPTRFSTTLMMVIVNNMSSNNPLINLTPIEPVCSGICEKLSGPTPATYDTLDRGDVAIFEWSYTLDGDDGESIEFTSGIENGFPGNTDSETVTIKTVELSNIAGQSISTLGFGQTTLVENVFVFHDETFGIPSGANNYQLSSLVPDSSGTPLTFDGVVPWLSTSSDTLTFWSANVSVTDAHFPAGNWNASLRYYHDPLPEAMSVLADDIWKDTKDGGMKYHFEDVSESTKLYDSGQDSTCYNLATTEDADVTNAVHSTTGGVNGSGAFIFDGDGYLRIESSADRGKCNMLHSGEYSIAGWFKSTAASNYHDKQSIIYFWDDTDCALGSGASSDDCAGYIVEIGDGTSDNHGKVFFTDGNDDLLRTICESDDGDNYIDSNWHHFVATMDDGGCELWIDADSKDTTNDAGGAHHDPGSGEDVYIGANVTASAVVSDEFYGAIDDILFWVEFQLEQDDIDALFAHSFGYGATEMDFLIGNYTDAGDLVGSAIKDDQDYPLKWGDPGHYSIDNDDNGLYRGGNYTALNMPEVRLNLLPDNNRLGFTMSFASGEPLEFYLDDSALDGAGGNLLSSYLQPTTLVSPQILPAFYTWDQDFPLVEFFAYSSGEEGSWLTYQGTRIVFNGTNGNYSGLVYQIDGVDMTINSDSPFIARNSDIDIDFYPPQAAPINAEPPGDDEKVIPGIYDVTVFLNGYNEDGTIFLRSINLGTITVLE
jgi:hypothetical protein